MSWNLPPPSVLPELVAADLVDEIDVEQAVAVDVGDRQAVAVVVVRRLVGLAGVVDDAVLERDAALGDAIGELEIVERRNAGHRLDLCVAKRRQPRRVAQHLRDDANGRIGLRLTGGTRGGLHRTGESRRGSGPDHDQHRGEVPARRADHERRGLPPGCWSQVDLLAHASP